MRKKLVSFKDSTFNILSQMNNANEFIDNVITERINSKEFIRGKLEELKIQIEILNNNYGTNLKLVSFDDPEEKYRLTLRNNYLILSDGNTISFEDLQKLVEFGKKPFEEFKLKQVLEVKPSNEG